MAIKLTIAQIKQQTPQGNFYCDLDGEITEVYDAKTGAGPHGVWTLQGFKIKDETGDIRCCLSNHLLALSRDWKGVKISLHCSLDRNDMPIGVGSEMNRWVGKDKKQHEEAQIKITATGQMQRIGGLEMPSVQINDDIPEHIKEAFPPEDTDLSDYTPRWTEDPPKEDLDRMTARETLEAKIDNEIVSQLIRAYDIAHMVLHSDKVRKMYGYREGSFDAYQSEDIRATANSIFIELNRRR